MSLLLLASACTPTDPKDTDSAPVVDSDSGPVGSAACPDGDVVTFYGDDGSTVDETEAMLSGDYTTFDQSGTLRFCPGTWYARLLVRADILLVGLGDDPSETVLSGGESGTILDVDGGASLNVQDVTLDRGAGLDVDHNSGGGGVYCGGDGAVNVDTVVFSNNFANDGPGLYTQSCTITIAHSAFVDNLADDDGGALTVWYTHLTVDDTTFSGNEALDGGALALFYGSATLTGLSFTGNTSNHVAGAAWFYNATVDLSDTTFDGNVNTVDAGGAVLLAGTGTFTDTTFTDNSALRGGGLFVYWDSSATGTDVTFSGNTPEDVFAADYSDAGGVAYTESGSVNFSCVDNACTGL